MPTSTTRRLVAALAAVAVVVGVVLVSNAALATLEVTVEDGVEHVRAVVGDPAAATARRSDDGPGRALWLAVLAAGIAAVAQAGSGLVPHLRTALVRPRPSARLPRRRGPPRFGPVTA